MDNINIGLTNDQARKAVAVNGLNILWEKKKRHPFIKLLSYFYNPLVIILMTAAVISLIVGEDKNATIIFLLVFLSVLLNFFQEHKTSIALEKIASRLSLKARVMRDGKEQQIDSKYVTIGDVVLLAAGDIVPADGRLLEADDFFVNESVMTGESFPVQKKMTSEKEEQILSGTNVVSGFARFEVQTIGVNTKYGQLASKLTVAKKTTAFEVGIKDFGYLILRVILIIVALVFVINIYNHKSFLESLIFSIAIAVGVTPELLPMIISINMAKGATRMAKKSVLVKRLDAIPDFGSMDVLCTDKTGTLTQDKISLVKFVDVHGNESESVLRYAYINSILETGIKSILDEAIYNYKKFNIDEVKKMYEVPYDFSRRRSSIVFQENNEVCLVCKGAPEELVKVCKDYCYENCLSNQPIEIEEVLKIYTKYSSDGYRVLAIAIKKSPNGLDGFGKEDEQGLTLIGYVAFYDPPKIDVKETIKLMENHGIAIKILTGDSALVTKKICQDLSIKIEGVVDGDTVDFDNLTEDGMKKLALENNIFARFSPIQKQRIVEALKKSNLVVGYLGDGINDALSIKTADVGISVENAVDIARESADIILLKKGLKELMDGVIEGRKTFGNTMKYLMMTLSSNFGNMFSMIGASMFLPFFPMLPGQILLNNFFYDASQSTIPSDNIDSEYLKKPKHWNIEFIKKYMIIFGSVSSLFDFLTFYLLYKFFSTSPSLFQTGWFLESFATQTFVIYVIRTRKVPFIQSWPSRYLVASTLGMFVLCFLMTQWPFKNYFGFTSLPSWTLLLLVGVVISYLLVVEMVKRLFYRLYKNA